jgi:endonuclease/exonuclease/phosphatase family metal-dependent hydrolase
MAKAFSIASWNVEHFRGGQARTETAIRFLKEQDPDLIGLYEVEGKEVFAVVTKQFPGYSFEITEGPQAQEILVGVRPGLSAFLTQRLEFKAGTTHMRPGLLATVTVAGKPYSVLFLHLASKVEPRGFGLRDDMAFRAIRFRKTLNKATGGDANYIFLGDLNTMGMAYPYRQAISADTELRRWDTRASRYYGLRRLSKTFDLTFSNGTGSTIPDGNLDHVYASKHLRFAEFHPAGGNRGEVDVRGWVNKKQPAQKDHWIERYSDHSLLYLEVQKV